MEDQVLPCLTVRQVDQGEGHSAGGDHITRQAGPLSPLTIHTINFNYHDLLLQHKAIAIRQALNS